jgi:UDP-N-acetylglucosamine diphosphorylase/glucosamine-1-phosphate N-acetyltransferase
MWKTSQLLNDLQIGLQLRPLTYTRHLRELWVGLSTIEVKWTAYIDELPTDIYLLGSLVPDPKLIKELKQLASNEALFWEEQWIAYRSDNEVSIPKNRKALADRPTYIAYPEDLLSANSQELVNEIQANDVDLGDLTNRGNTIIHPENCYIDPSAEISGTILDASQGPIYIGANTKIQIGTLIQGPAAILDGAITNLGAKIRPNTTIGKGCKVGGEISASLFFPYSNKAHEGYLGNSIIGSFCNLGALTTGSNVRNDLKNVYLYDYRTQQARDTGLKSFGVLMGDFVCTGILTKFNTGTVIGNHCNISGSTFLPKFIPSLTWGEFPHLKEYLPAKAIENTKAWIQTKNQEIPENLLSKLEQIWKEEANARN